MGICEDAPDDYCGHVLKPEDAGVDRELNHGWHEDTRNAVCIRYPKYEGLCVWHADTDEKTTDELVEARLEPRNVSWKSEYVKEHLSGTILREVDLPTGFSLSGCILLEAEFRDTELQGAEFRDTELRRAEFRDTELQRAKFPEADLYRTKFKNANLREAGVRDANLRKAVFRDTNLRKAEFPEVDLYKAEFRDAKLRRAKFRDTYLREAKFRDAYFREAEFLNSNLRDVNFSEANAREAIFSEADLRGVTFNLACEMGVDTEEDGMDEPLGASLEDAQFEGGTDLRGADFSGARLYQIAFRDVRINDETSFGWKNGIYGEECRYDYDPNTDTSIDEDTSQLEAAAWTYRRLESLFEDNAMYERARNAHIRKEEAQRAQYKQRIRTLGRYLVASFNWHVHRHGESLKRLLGVSGSLIGLCGIVYAVAGVARSTPETTTYRIAALSEFQRPEGYIDLLNGLYFSVITFSTIGYGDFYPASPVSRLLVGIESLSGALLIALFVFVIGRRVAR